MAKPTTFNFASMNSDTDLGIIVNGIKRDSLAKLNPTFTSVAGRHGEVYEGTQRGGKEFEVECTLMANSEVQREAEIDELAGFFGQTTDGDLYPLIFSDRADTIYYAVLTEFSALSPLSQTVHDGNFTLKFFVPEGVGYMDLIEQPITEPTITIEPLGTADTAPIFELTAGETLSQVGISDSEGNFIYLGGGYDVDPNEDTPTTATSELILADSANDLSLWTKLTTNLPFTIENGSVASDASLATTPDAIEPAKKNGEYFFGTNPNGAGKKGWYGAVYHRMLTTSLPDWKVRARFFINNRYGRAQNKIELYLLDANKKRIGKLMVKDNGNSMTNMLQAQIGYDSNGTHKEVYTSLKDASIKTTKKNSLSKKPVYFKHTKKVTDKKTKKTKTVYTTSVAHAQSNEENTFTDFYGYIELTKKGNVYSATVQKLDSKGKEISGKAYSLGTYTDKNNTFGDSLAGVAIYMAKHDITEDSNGKAYKPNQVQLTDLRIYKVNLKGEVDMVADKGDVITIDCDNKQVFKNGVLYNNLYLSSSYLTMLAGQPNVYSVSPTPSATNTWKVKYSPKKY